MAKELLRKHRISPASADFLSSSSSPSPGKKMVCIYIYTTTHIPHCYDYWCTYYFNVYLLLL